MPEITVVIVTYNAAEYLGRCLDSISRVDSGKTFDIMVIDNASTDETAECVARFHERLPLTYLRLSSNCGFCGGANAVRSRTSSEYLVFLDDDTVVPAGWLADLVEPFRDGRVGLVGCRIIDPQGTIFSAENEIGPEGPIVVGAGEPDAGQRSYRGEVEGVIGTCQAIRRELFDQLGGFDERFYPCQFEDTDLCLRVRKAGYSVWYQGSLAVTHHHLFRTEGRESGNLAAFQQKWNGEDPRWLRPRYTGGGITLSPGAPDLYVVGDFMGTSGLSYAARTALIALSKLDLTVQGVNLSQLASGRRLSPDAVYLMVLGVHFASAIYGYIAEGGRMPKTVAWVAWELELLEDWEIISQFLHEAWVPSEYCYRTFTKNSAAPVHRIPYTIARPAVLAEAEPHRPFIFLTNADGRSVFERKNPLGVVSAFQSAFTPEDDTVRCIVKLTHVEDTAEVAKIRARITGWPNIELLVEELSERGYWELMLRCDCYVSLHRSEGFGLPPAQALLLEKPIIVTDYGGTSEYADKDTAYLVRWEYTTLAAANNVYPAGARWAEPDLRDAAAQMRRVYHERKEAARKARAGRLRIEREFSPEAVGRAMGERLSSILGREISAKG